jgi:hypothetical protein
MATVVALAAGLAGCSSPKTLPAVAPDVSWVTHQVGAFGIPQRDLARAANSGVTMSFTVPGRRAAGTRAPGIIVDPFPAGLIQQYLPASCQKIRTPCPVSGATRKRLLGDVRKHLASLDGDARVRGLYVVDDYPGNIAQILRDIHELVGESNRQQHSRRATVCPFLAPLDSIDPVHPDQPATEYHDFLDRALLNYSPEACDIVAAYSYSAIYVPADHVDWSLRTMLPYIRDSLTRRGWDPVRHPFIGIPQAFGYDTPKWFAPDPDQLRTEIDAFCRGGVTAIAGYAWSDGHAGPNTELGNDATLRRGFANGVAACRQIWQPPTG